MKKPKSEATRRMRSENPERDAAIVAMREVGNKTHREVGLAFNLTPARIRQIIYRDRYLKAIAKGRRKE